MTIYFAYGSNMLTSRLSARVGKCEAVGVAILPRHTLRFHKKSKDGTGKCDAWRTADPSEKVFGVVFEFADDQEGKLDKAEGVGKGYGKAHVEVNKTDGTPIRAMTYLADVNAISDQLRPTREYLDWVMRGAEEHGLPDGYIARYIKSVSPV